MTKRISFISLFVIMLLLVGCAFALLSFQSGTFKADAAIFGAIYICVLMLFYILMAKLAKHHDRLIFLMALFLVSIGLIIQYRIGADIAKKQLVLFLISIAAMVVMLALMGKPNVFRRLRWVLMGASIGILAVLLIIGDAQYGAKNWIKIGGLSFQPSEFVKVALVFILAHYLDDYKKVNPWPMVAFVAACAALLMLERDLGGVAVIGVTSLIMFYVATGNKLWTGIGVVCAGGGAVASYYLFSHVRVRVAVWKNPWATYSSSGYQIAQGLMAIASGGLFGVGLSLGSPKLIPAYHTDYIFAVICEEMGLIVGLMIIALYVMFALRGAIIALNASSRFLALLAFGTTVMISMQCFIIIAGVVKLIPLTGVTLPFVSYGGSSLISCMMLLGILEGVFIASKRKLDMAQKAVEE